MKNKENRPLNGGDNYELVYQRLIKKVSQMDLSRVVLSLGGDRLENRFRLRLLGTPYMVDREGIWRESGKQPNVSIRIVLCHYLIQAGQSDLTGEWVSYRDFKDSAFFISNFQVNAEDRTARYFSGKGRKLEEAAERLGGQPYGEFQTGDVCRYFQALPRVPMLLVFYDRDEDFPASCKILFDRSAPAWLDMECLAVLGWLLAELLIKNGSSPN